MKNGGKLIFFDIDGTLLDHEKQLPPSTKAAIAELRAQGHEVAIATGRSPFMFRELRAELHLDTYVSLNGQYVVFRGKTIFRNPLDTHVLQALTTYAEGRSHPVAYMSEDGMKVNVPHHDWISNSMGSLKLALPEHEPDYYLSHAVYQAMVFCEEHDEAAYRGQFPGTKFVRWHEVAMDVMPGQGSKAGGILEIMKQMDFRKDDVYAFGDHLNDLEMIAAVGHGIAMGNAVEALKRNARYVTKPVDEDGIRHGLKMVGLI